ncbi:MAG: hypothetical protein M2R46_00331 [Verrucomicrobia subdivision 3 bacterium]|nr:hypothetical protein [Limisphaerales bacterium]
MVDEETGALKDGFRLYFHATGDRGVGLALAVMGAVVFSYHLLQVVLHPSVGGSVLFQIPVIVAFDLSGDAFQADFLAGALCS